MMKVVAIQTFSLFFGILLLIASPAFAGDDLRELIQELGTCETRAKLDEQVLKIGKRLDELTTAVLRNERGGAAARSGLRTVLADTGELKEGKDVQLWPVLQSNNILVVHNIPYTGATRKVMLRLWEPGGETNEGKLKPFDETGHEYAKMSMYPVVNVHFLAVNDITYAVLLGEIGHGRGKLAMSVWNVGDGRCVFARELDWGERANVVTGKELIALNIEWDNRDSGQVESRIETYGWRDGAFRELNKAAKSE